MVHEQPDRAGTVGVERRLRQARSSLESTCRIGCEDRLANRVLSGLFLATALPEKLGRVKIFATGEVASRCVILHMYDVLVSFETGRWNSEVAHMYNVPFVGWGSGKISCWS
jgi:hypothetical protein